MKISEVGIDNGYAIVRGWVGSDGAATDVLIGGITDGATATDAPATLEFAGLTVTDLGGNVTLVASSWKVPVRCATTANGTLATAYAAGQVVDGITLATSDRILVKNQAAAAENGVYTVNATGAPSRSLDLGLAALVPGAVVDVLAGSTLAASLWMCTNQTAPVLDTDAITFALVNGSSTVTGGGTGNDITPALSNAMPAWVKPTGSGVITNDAQGRLTIDSGSAYKAFPSMAFLEGRLHLVYRSGTDHVASHDGVIKYRYSDDLGRTFSAAVTIASPSGSDDLRDPNIIALSTGRLLVAYFRYNATALDVRVRYSDNRGQTWSSDYTIPATFTGGECGNSAQPIELPDGTIIIPGYGIDTGPVYKSVLWTSTDGGLTFGNQTTVASSGSIQYTEWQPRLLASGKIVGLIRDDVGGHTYRVVSTDLGATWGSVTDVLSSTAGRPDWVEFFPSALLWHGRGTSQRSRWAVSWDEGATWTALQETDSGGTLPAMYHAPVVLAPGYIAVAYSLENSSTDADLFMRYYHDGYGTDPLGNVLALVGSTLVSTTAPSTGDVLTATSAGASHWAAPAAAGVTSVSLTVPAEFSVSGSPVTSSGTLAISKANESANTVWAGPTSGAAAAPAFRALVAADIPAGVGTTDHEHIMNLWFSGDGATTAFELPAAPFDSQSVRVWVSGTLTDVTLSGTLLTTMTFGSAPASATSNIVVDLVAAAA